MANETAYKALVTYIKKAGFDRNFTANALRDRLSVHGVQPKQMGGLISRAVRNGLIVRIGSTTSNNPNHKQGEVGVYARY